MPYLLHNGARVAELSGQHFYLTLVSLGIAILIGLPLGIIIHRVRWLRGPVLAVFSVLYTVPSLSLLVLLIPLPVSRPPPPLSPWSSMRSSSSCATRWQG